MGRNTRWLIIIPAVFFALFAKPAKADVLGEWTYSQSCSTSGSIEVVDNTIILHGPDQGGCSGAAHWVKIETTIPADVDTIDFTWAYQTTDGWVYDPPQYGINGVYTLITQQNNATGELSVPVEEGDVFTFRQYSIDTCCAPGHLTISNLSLWASITTSTTSTTTTTTTSTVPETTVPVTNPTTTTVQETTTTVPATTTSVANSTSTSSSSLPTTTTQAPTTTSTSTTIPETTTTSTSTSSSVPQTTSTESTTTTTQPPPVPTPVTQPQISEPEPAEPSVPEEPEPTETGTTTTLVEEATPEEMLPEETTTTDEPSPEPYPDTTDEPVEDTYPTVYPEETLPFVEEPVVEETTPEEPETPLEAPLSDEEVDSLIAEAETTEALVEALAELSPEQVEQVIESLLAEEPTEEQATALASSPEVLAVISTEQAAQIFEVLDVGALTDTQTEELIAAIESAPTEIREEFEDKIDPISICLLAAGLVKQIQAGCDLYKQAKESFMEVKSTSNPLRIGQDCITILILYDVECLMCVTIKVFCTLRQTSHEPGKCFSKPFTDTSKHS